MVKRQEPEVELEQSGERVAVDRGRGALLAHDAGPRPIAIDPKLGDGDAVTHGKLKGMLQDPALAVAMSNAAQRGPRDTERRIRGPKKPYFLDTQQFRDACDLAGLPAPAEDQGATPTPTPVDTPAPVSASESADAQPTLATRPGARSLRDAEVAARTLKDQPRVRSRWGPIVVGVVVLAALAIAAIVMRDCANASPGGEPSTNVTPTVAAPIADAGAPSSSVVAAPDAEARPNAPVTTAPARTAAARATTPSPPSAPRPATTSQPAPSAQPTAPSPSASSDRLFKKEDGS
jgi:hypothetical protein